MVVEFEIPSGARLYYIVNILAHGVLAIFVAMILAAMVVTYLDNHTGFINKTIWRKV